MKTIRIVIINGSLRPKNDTRMASALVADELRKDADLDVHVINPGEYGLVFPGELGGEGMDHLRVKSARRTPSCRRLRNTTAASPA